MKSVDGQFAPAPLFRDPIYDGAADPTIIWNRNERSWWILYTQRRANADVPRRAWCHGTDIGIASSADGGQTWVYRGVVEGLDFERGRNTFWAPEVLWHQGQYHMYVSYVRGVPDDWYGERHIVHYTSNNLWEWRFESILSLSSHYVIDACAHQLRDGRWRLWYKDEKHGSHTYAADSSNLYHWSVVGPVITDCAHEGPNVFQWQGFYWMVVDHWNGLGVYRSRDAEMWLRQEDILSDKGTRPDDAAKGRHADVLVHNAEAYIFYFTHPEEGKSAPPSDNDVVLYEHRRTSIQVAKLICREGRLYCDRDAPFSLKLPTPQ